MIGEAEYLYGEALHRGIAKEQARALLPEGLTPSKLYVNGTMRSWITFLQARLDPSTQKEHRLVAQDVLAVLRDVAPVTVGAFFPLENV
jgi:thymidylate synthase (FAD)